MKDWKIVEHKMRLLGHEEYEITERISLIQMVAGNYMPKIDGSQKNPEDLTPEDQNTIRKEFGMKEKDDPSKGNPLIPGDNDFPKKKEGEEEEPGNPLIP